MAEAKAAIQIDVRGVKKIIGKILNVEGKQIYFRRYSQGTALFRKWNAFSFDARVIPLLVREGVTAIHYEDESNSLFTVPLSVFIANAQAGNWGEGAQLYLPVSAWVKTQRDYSNPWTNNITSL